MKTRTRLLATLLAQCMATLAFANGDQALAPIGGGGGGPFFGRCQGGDILNGFELRTGDDVDAIRPVCAHPLTPSAIGPRNIHPQSFGGDGGGITRLVCPDTVPLIAALEVGYEGEKTIIVNNVHIYCTVAMPNQRPPGFPSAVFDGPSIHVSSHGPFTGGDPVFLNFAMESCPNNSVAVGIHGRSGIWLDAVGLLCGDSPINPPAPPVTSIGRIPSAGTVVKSIGKVKLPSTGPASGPPSPPRSICDAAASARARNSPAAPNLEAQCRAAGGPARQPPSPAPPDQPWQAPLDLDAMAARGAELVQQNALAAELREQVPDGPVRRGFDIGMAAWENQTIPDKLNGAAGGQLDQPGDEGFKIAASFAMNWNRNVDLAVIGAQIANNDAVLARARGAEADAFYRLGFDIATGIYGDRKLGARGNTATGPGAFAIRDLMNLAAQRGFNASTALNLSRHY